ncbi:predicted protein [Naegleria gruberi]|uniref:Predicted protein n=1 Tax=Naegleria gruberi TaxID=5762 RepID=D2VNP5_NAEGR|nr:uncharacterized protein NAEGRDRAFT_51048 [Naegleria gruberi]EFC41539.1 predicted protein [Naegleria gruberi]|eukprot:XP_002674283.1 predicted protein [Naegleria gruberi strain NEG-M]
MQHLNNNQHDPNSNNNLINNIDNNNIIHHDGDEKILQEEEGTTKNNEVTKLSPFLKPSSQRECEETKYRLQIFHPSYTTYVMNNFSNSLKDNVCEWGQYLVDDLHFKLILDDGNTLIVEREIFKSSFVKSLRGKLRGRVKAMEDCGKSVNNGINKIIDTEFKPYSSKNKQCLINFYERFTLRIVFKRKPSIPNNFILASGQTFYLYNGCVSHYPGLDCRSSSDVSDQVFGIEPMITHFGLTSTVCDLMLCTILQHRMPKYYFENYRVPEDLDQAQYLALVDVFYYEMLSSETRLSVIPVFVTQNYLNTPFELLKYGLEMSFDILYNQLSTHKKIGLVEKLIATYLNQDFTPEHVETIHSLSSLERKDLKANKYTSVSIEKESLKFTVVCLETVTTIQEKKEQSITLNDISDKRVKIVTIKLMEYTLQLPNLFNGNTVGSIKISTKNLSSATTNNGQPTQPVQPNQPANPQKSNCSLL